MEIKVQCEKGKDGKWSIGDPGDVYVTENRVVWTFQGLEPGVVPLLDFQDNPPFGPFPRGWLTSSTITAELDELPATTAIHHYQLVLVQWKPDGSGGTLATLPHGVKIVRPQTTHEIKVCWQGPGSELKVEPPSCPAGGASRVEWQFEIPEGFFATIDFGSSSPDDAGGPRPLGPFAELHGRYENGTYRVTGQTDLRKAVYQYVVTLYSRETGPVFRHDPQIDNNGVPPG